MNLALQKKITQLHETLVGFYKTHQRNTLPWRRSITPYRIVVSEIMLQQTQVDRVIPFFNNWMKQFPSWKKLANAPQADVLRAWKGLGYNSRALRLQKLARVITDEYNGRVPSERSILESLPGIGPYTAGAIRAFAHNQWDTFIETNIRTVFFYEVLSSRCNIADTDVYRYIDTLASIAENEGYFDARHFYYALMDYGSYLKNEKSIRLNAKSKHYTKQKKFAGSDRQIRGVILDILLENKKLSFKKLYILVTEKLGDREEGRVRRIVDMLVEEGFIVRSSTMWQLK